MHRRLSPALPGNPDWWCQWHHSVRCWSKSRGGQQCWVLDYCSWLSASCSCRPHCLGRQFGLQVLEKSRLRDSRGKSKSWRSHAFESRGKSQSLAVSINTSENQFHRCAKRKSLQPWTSRPQSRYTFPWKRVFRRLHGQDNISVSVAEKQVGCFEFGD